MHELQWFCFNISWPKTKLQNIGSGPKPPDISVDGNIAESVNSFVYLDGSLQSSDGQFRPDLTCHIGLACAVMTSLKRIWSDKRLTLDTKLRIYQTLVLCVLLYTTDTWTLLSGDVRDAFHQKCLRQLLGIRWYDRVRNDEVLQRTSLTSLSHLISRRCISVYLGMWLDLTTSHRQTWLFSSTSTYHSTDLLTACGVAHGTSDSTFFSTEAPSRSIEIWFINYNRSAPQNIPNPYPSLTVYFSHLMRILIKHQTVTIKNILFQLLANIKRAL